MKSFAVAAFVGAASAAWAPPAYGGQSSAVESSSVPAEEYSQPAEGYSTPAAYTSPAAATTSSAAWGYSAPSYGGASSSSSSSMATYACNPAHSYPNGAQCVSTYGTLSLVTPSPSTPGSYGTGSVPSYPKPTGGYGGSWGHGNGTEGGYGGHGGDSWVTQVVTELTTVCPYATTLTTNGAIYTATESETLTITDCPCQETKPVESVQPSYTTEIVTEYTTVCPYSTQITYGSTTHTATAGETVTVSQCPTEGCTVTKELPQTWVVPTYTTVCPKPSVPTTVTIGTETYPVTDSTTIIVTAPTTYATYTSHFTQPVAPVTTVIASSTYEITSATSIVYSSPTQGGYTVTAPFSSIWSSPPAASTPAGPVGGAQPSGYAPAVNGSSPISPEIPQQTGNGAEKVMAGGAAVAAVIGALFL